MNTALSSIITFGTFGIHIEVLSVQALGSGAVAWLSVTPSAPDIVGYYRRSLRVEETGKVPILRVFHEGGPPVLLPADLVFSGGLQTRMIARTVVIAPGSRVEVPVRCVESGRWSSSDDSAARTFSAADTVSVRMRRALSRSKGKSFARTGNYSVEQQEVWDRVDGELTGSGLRSGTSSYDTYLSAVKARQQEAVRAAAVEPPTAANGAVILMASGAWLEAFPSNDVLVASSDGLLADLFAADERPFESDPRTGVERALSLVWRTECRPIGRVAGTLGDPYALDRSGVHGSCVLLAGALAHLAVGFRSERALTTESPVRPAPKRFSW
jgi:hypothetical protein